MCDHSKHECDGSGGCDKCKDIKASSGVGMDKGFCDVMGSLFRLIPKPKKPETVDENGISLIVAKARLKGKDADKDAIIKELSDHIRDCYVKEDELRRQLDRADENTQRLEKVLSGNVECYNNLNSDHKRLTKTLATLNNDFLALQKERDSLQSSLHNAQISLAKKIADKSVASGVAQMIMKVIAPHITEPDATLTNAMQGTIEKILQKAFLDWISSKPAKKNKAAQKPVTAETQTASSAETGTEKKDDEKVGDGQKK
jgi:hypothetical protein